LNLADFPISVLHRKQPRSAEGVKVDTIVYEATRYDRLARRRVPQRVTLTTSTRYGLPTPADENVILGLLFVAKHTANFASPTVHFCPYQLFRIMRWSSNSRSYQRLREVLRRLKSLTIVSENAWWDAEGRAYAQEFATGILAEYEIVFQVQGRRKPGSLPPSWVTWTPTFFASLQKGNLKRLDLERLFALRLPTAQRMYRFLDKRFHQSPTLDMDLTDFACGHIGLARTENVALLKQRLAPAIAELEAIGFIERVDNGSRYLKVRPGIWRICFERAEGTPRPMPYPSAKEAPTPAEEMSPHESTCPRTAKEERTAEWKAVAAFHRLRFGDEQYRLLPKELAFARAVLGQYGEERVQALLPRLVERLAADWPEGKTFLAAKGYLHEVAADVARKEQHATRERDAQIREEQEQAAQARQRAERERFKAKWQPVWQALSESEQHEIRQAVIREKPYVARVPTALERFCLEELAKRERQP